MTNPRWRIARPVALFQRQEGRCDWYRIHNRADGPAEVWIYDEIGGWGITAGEFVAELRDLDTESIELRINSPGGEVFDGIAIYEALRSHPAAVTTYVDSLAASIASVIAMAGDRRVIARNGTMMIHDGHGFAVGTAQDMRELAELLDRCSDNIASIYAERAGGDVGEWRQRMRATTWYSADEAVAAGLATETRAARRDAPDPRDLWDLSLYDRGDPVPELVATAVGPHDTAVREGEWDAGTHEERLPSPVPLATVRRMYAAYDESAVADGAVPKSACRLPHHAVSEDGTPGAAILNGVRNALARLPQTHGLSDAERATAERHLRAHLAAAGGGETEDHTGAPVLDYARLIRDAVREAAK